MVEGMELVGGREGVAGRFLAEFGLDNLDMRAEVGEVGASEIGGECVGLVWTVCV